MKNTFYTLIFCLLIVFCGFCSGLDNESQKSLLTNASTVYVGGTGPGNFSSIQAAIDNASSGNIVFVYNGTYRENILVDKTLIIQGEKQNETVIDGRGFGVVVNVTANWTIVRSLTIKNSGPEGYPNPDSALKLYRVNNCSIADCRLEHNMYGICLFYSHNNRIEENTIADIDHDGISSFFSQNNSIIRNFIFYCFGDGVDLHGSDGNFIIDNIISLNGFNFEYMAPIGYGIRLWSSNMNTVHSNVISKNYYGMQMASGSSDNQIFNNILRNKRGNVRFYDDPGDNMWDNGQIGNYWGDYKQKNPTARWSWSQKIWNKPYVLREGNQDKYPSLFPSYDPLWMRLGIYLIDFLF